MCHRLERVQHRLRELALPESGEKEALNRCLGLSNAGSREDGEVQSRRMKW